MKLGDRLDSMLGRSSEKAEEKKQRTISDLRRRIEELTRGRDVAAAGRDAQRLERMDIEGLVDGRVVQTPAGPCFVAEHRYPMAWDHGRVRLDRLFGVDPRALAILGGDDRLASLDPRRTIFFDTETTGLAGGTGTYAFLVGIGAFEADEFVVRQVFMRDFVEEAASLRVIAERLEAAAFLVSFNGKTFDAPLLSTRMIMNRLASSLDELPHLDLLHPARRLYRERLVDCRLGTIEERELNFGRADDVPSHMVPDLYRSYLRNRDGRIVARIFTHNAYDILSLVALTAHLAELVSRGHELGAEAGLLLSTARLLRDRGHGLDAQRLFELALERSAEGDPLTEWDARLEVAMACKRRGEFDVAAGHFRAMLERGPFDPLPYEELAKHLEHRLRDYSGAELLVVKALGFLSAGAGAGNRVQWIASFEHRLARLRRKKQV